jgi:hypothetical protein
LKLTPITRSEARMFVAKHHRHNHAPSVAVFQVALRDGEGEVRGVAFGGLPRARKLMDGRTLEVIRIATDGTRNACSMLYGACCRAGAALGYERAVTYTLVSEDGASLRASGWELDEGYKGDHNPDAWQTHAKARSGPPVDLFGTRARPVEAKRRWWKKLR